MVQARTIIGGVHVHIGQERPPISTAAMISWLVVAAIPLTVGVILGKSGASHVHDLSGVVALGAAALIGLVAVRIATVVWEWWLLSREQRAELDVVRHPDRGVARRARTGSVLGLHHARNQPDRPRLSRRQSGDLAMPRYLHAR